MPGVGVHFVSAFEEEIHNGSPGGYCDKMKRLQSKVAIVTASTRGIGFEIAKRLCSEGASVVISSRKSEAVNAAVDTLRKQGLIVEGTSCHVGNAADRQKLLDFTISKFGRLDILVSNAAANPHFGPLHTPAMDAWAKIMDTNVTASLAMAQCCLPHLTTTKVLLSPLPFVVFCSSRFSAGKHRLYIIYRRIHTIRRTRNVNHTTLLYSFFYTVFYLLACALSTPFCNRIFRYNIRFGRTL